MITNKYVYPELKRLDKEVGRFYQDSNENSVPSVTTVLSNTSDKSDSIQQWRKKVGETEANRITKQSTDIGSNEIQYKSIYRRLFLNINITMLNNKIIL